MNIKSFSKIISIKLILHDFMTSIFFIKFMVIYKREHIKSKHIKSNFK